MALQANRLEILAFADELSEHPQLLARWAAEFGPEDAVTLLIHPGQFTPEEVGEHLPAALNAAGLSAETNLDLQAFTGPFTLEEDAGTARRCARVLTRGQPAPPFDRLIPVTEANVASLRVMLPKHEAQVYRQAADLRTVAIAGGEFAFRNDHSDMTVIKNVFEDKAYSFDRYGFDAWPGVERYTRAATGMSRPLIIDAGANIGASSVFLAVTHPHATVLAIEPEEGNYELLVRNTRHLHNVVPMRNALAARRGTLQVSDPGGGGCAMRTGADIARGQIVGEVHALTVADLLSDHPTLDPFILKVDIEGAETELFAGDTEAIDRFPVVVVELHDRFFPGEARAQSFLRWHLQQQRDFHQTGENTWSFDQALALA
jgi:FkbM family methyltransferase